jgi:hypothetical protein
VSRLRRGAAAAAFALALGAGLVGCEAGFDSQSYLIDPDNAEARVGGLLVRNLVMVKAEEGEAAGIAGTFVNTGSTADVLESVQIEGTEGSSATSVTPGLELPPGRAVAVGSGASPPLVVPDAQQLRVGTFVTMTLTFREAGTAELKVPLEEASTYYGTVAPTMTPTTEPTATPTTPTATP